MALRESKQRLYSILGSSPCIMFLKDAEGRYVYVNPKFQRLCDLRPEQIVGRTDAEIFPPGQADAFRTNDLKVLQAGAPLEFEEVALQKDGLHTSIVHKFPLIDAKGRVQAICGVVTDITGRKRLEEALRKREESLRHLSGRLFQSQEEERRRFARELHDSIGQILVTLITQLHMVKERIVDFDDGTSSALVECLKLALDAEREIRTVSYLLHPPILDDLGLACAIHWYADGFQQRSGIQVELDLADGLPRLSPEAETALFRVVQEGLTNIHRHSGSPVAKIRLTSNKKEFVLEISDKGRGMPAGVLERPEAAGVGITGMRERMRQLGGRVEIKPNKRGTVVTVMLPRGPVEHLDAPTRAAEMRC